MRKDVELIFNHFKELDNNLQINSQKTIRDRLEKGKLKVVNYAAINGIHPVIPETICTRKISISGINCEWICAPGADNNKRLLFIHGGGFFGGSLDTHRGFSAALSEFSGLSVLAVDYRLAPEHPFPAALDDCLAAYGWLLENGPQGRQDAESIFVAGDSAGGNLSLTLLLRLKGASLKMPNAVLPVSPVVDFAGKGKSVSLKDLDPVLNKKAVLLGLPVIYLFGRDILKLDQSKIQLPVFLIKYLFRKRKLIRNPLVSPIHGDLSGLPPIFINVGEKELLRDDAIRFVEVAKKQGVKAKIKVWPGMVHVFIAFWGHVPESEQCFREMADFIRENS